MTPIRTAPSRPLEQRDLTGRAAASGDGLACPTQNFARSDEDADLLGRDAVGEAAGDEHANRMGFGCRIGNDPGRRQLTVKNRRFSDAFLVNPDHQMAQVQAAENGHEIERGNQKIDKLHPRP